MENFIQVIKILDEEQLKVVNDYIDSLEFTPNTVFSGQGGQARVDDRIRTSTGTVMWDGDPATDLLHEQLNAGLLEYRERLVGLDCAIDGYPIPGGFNTSSHREGIQVLEYDVGKKYNWHFDECTDPNQDFYHRKVSIVLYLTDDFEGGTTRFKPERDYKPKAGYALYFPSNWCFMHCATPVKSGKKRVAVTWYYCKDHMNTPVDEDGKKTLVLS